MKKILSKKIAHKSHDLVEAPNGARKGQKEDLSASVLERGDVDNKMTKDDEHDESLGEDDTDGESNEESEEESATFSDIDDREVDGYLLHNAEEKKLKKLIWETMNREYLVEQAAKEAAAAAGLPIAAVAKRKKEKQRRVNQEKNKGPAQSAGEATKKRLSSKINYDCLAKLFDEEPEDASIPKKVRFDLPSDNQDKSQFTAEDKNEDELESTDDFEDGDVGEYENNWSSGNMNESYFPEDDGYGYNYDDDEY